ncbi:MAG: C40 family peptidase [Verrucomicrobiae bacterium]|nr:C40 family peptidase [Verrucomicrobiae bacterium]
MLQVPGRKMWQSLPGLLALGAALFLFGCVHVQRTSTPGDEAKTSAAERAIQPVKHRFAPDPHLAIYQVQVQAAGKRVVLTGWVDSAEAKAETLAAVTSTGFEVIDRISVLPAPELGEATWAIASVSTANARELPAHGAELGMQVLMGHVVRVWAQTNGWYFVQSADRYLSWAARGSLVRGTQAEVEAWKNAPLLLVTALEEQVLERPHSEAQPVSEVVTGCLVKRTGEEGEWYQVELPDQRTGYLPKNAAEDYAAWQRTRQPTPDAIERTARTLLGRPYIWGGNSPKALDCSGFTKLTFFLNGVELDRNASHQARQGVQIPLDADLSHLRKGDLVFFGTRARPSRPERVTHVGIYLGEKLFIHSSDRVRINSLDPNSPISDAHRIRTLISARRVLPEM